MTTFTASLWTNGAKVIHAGVVSAHAKFTASVTGTASSVFMLAKIPHGATIIDYVFHARDAAANQVYKLGLQYPQVEAGGTTKTTTVTESALLTTGLSTTGGAATATGDGRLLPLRVSIENDVAAQDRFAWIISVATVAISASAVLHFSVLYTMDENAGS